MDMTIRPAEPAEYAALGEITAEAYLGDGLLDFGADDPYLVQLRDVPRRAAEAEVLVATDARGHVLGGVTYAPPGNPWADIAAADEAEFRMLAVSRQARGAGAGEALVRACIERARATAGSRGSSCRPSRPCTGPTGSTGASASCGPPSGTGIPSATSGC